MTKPERNGRRREVKVSVKNAEREKRKQMAAAGGSSQLVPGHNWDNPFVSFVPQVVQKPLVPLPSSLVAAYSSSEEEEEDKQKTQPPRAFDPEISVTESEEEPMSKEKRKEVRRIFPEISAESSSEDTPHPTVDECSQVPANVGVAEKRPKSKMAKRRERMKKKKEEAKAKAREKKPPAKGKENLRIVVDVNLPRTSKSSPQRVIAPTTPKKTKKVQEDRGHEWVTYVREPASPGAPAREIEEVVYAEPEVRNLGPLMNLTVAPTKEFLKTTNSAVGPRSGLLYTGWSRLFRIERVDDYHVARLNGMTFGKERIGDPRKHEILVCGTDGPYTGDVIPILEFDPLDEVIQLGTSKVERTIKRRLNQELLEFVERRSDPNDDRVRENMRAEEPISVVEEEQARVEVADVGRDQEEDDGNGDLELELMAQEELF